MIKTILVVEDEKALSKAIKANLEKNNFSAVTVSSAPAAMEVMKTNGKIDAVWLDHYLLGNKTGLDFLYDLRENDNWKNIPVFVVTNSVSDEKVETYQLLGIEKYFVKSNNSLADIVGTIQKALV